MTEKTEKELLEAILAETKRTTKAANMIGIEIVKIRSLITGVIVLVVVVGLISIIF